jgi:UDP-glucuronate 4-epimerase
MKRILVTGGAGFIGSHLVEALLERGDAVQVVDSFDTFYDPEIKRRNVRGFKDRVRFAEFDIRDVSGMASVFRDFRPETVVHLAARAGVRPSIEQPVLYADVNVTGTANLLEVSRQTGVHKFVFASSSSVYGVNDKVPFSEADPVTHPISPYAATKLAGEHLCQVYHHLYGMDTVCLRFFTVYGPRQRPDLAIHKFTRAIVRGEPIPVFGDGSTRRDYTFIRDILQGILSSVDRRFEFEVINLGESRPIMLRELIAVIEAAVGRKAVIDRRPLQPGDVPVTYADIAKAERLLDYRPEYEVEKGIIQFVAWFRDTQATK